MRWIFCIIAITSFFTTVAYAASESIDLDHYPVVAIPYKVDATPIEQHGSRVMWGVLCFLIGVGGVLYFANKKKLNWAAGRFLLRTKKEVHVLDRIRLDSKVSLYVVVFNNQKFLLASSSGVITTISQADVTDVEANI